MLYPTFLSGEGIMNERIRQFNWEETPLGPVEKWKQSLQSALGICLNSNFPIAVYWGSQLVLLYNDAWSPIPGNKHPWALGRQAKEVWPEIWEEIEPQFAKAFAGKAGGSKNALLPMQRHGYTEECYFDFTFTPVYGEEGRVDGIFNAVIETTYQLIHERRTGFLQHLTREISASRSSDELFKKLNLIFSDNPADVSFCYFFTTNGNQKPEMVASTSTEKILLELPFQEVSKKGSSCIISNLSDYFNQVPGSYWPESPVEAVLFPLKANNGGITGYLFAGLSARRRYDHDYQIFFDNIAIQISTVLNIIQSLEEERKKAESLAQIDKAKTVFFSNISHEFRTPLTLILGPLEEILSSPEKNHTANLDLAYSNALRLQKLVNTLLDFSRIEAGRMEPRYVAADICALTADIAGIFRSAVEKAGMKLIITCGPVNHPVYLDVEMYEKIVLNLVSNAFKYTLAGSITVQVMEDGDHIVLEVRDTGIGIPENEIQKLFERFHRVQNNRGRSMEGSGIGLALVKELVKIHHGEIDVISQENKGSAFRVRIPNGVIKPQVPLANDQMAEIGTGIEQKKSYADEALKWSGPEENRLPHSKSVQQRSPEQQDDSALHKESILIADDNQDMRNYILHLLSEDYQVFQAADGAKAFELAAANLPDIILTDIMMPVLDGYSLLLKLRTDPLTKNIPVIFLSARAGEEAKVEGLDAGADDYLVKPFSARELRARISALIKISRARKQLRESEEHFRSLTMALPQLVWVTDSSGRQEFVTDRWKEYTGFDLLDGHSWSEAIHPEDSNTVEEAWSHSLRSGDTYKTEARLRGKDGTYRWFHVQGEPIRNEKNNIVKWVGAFTDIHEQKLAEGLLRQSEENLEILVKKRTEELERSNEDLQQFAHVASHDMKEPIRKIKIFSELLSEEIHKQASVEANIYLSKIKSASERMLTMMDGVLRYAGMDGYLQGIAPIDLNEVIKSVETDLEMVIQKKKAVILRDELPQIHGYPLLIYQLFYNLVSNALKFSRPDIAPLLEIRYTREIIDNKIFARLRFKDNGIGFEQEDAQKIFQTFMRLNTREEYEGTGLGLSLCKKIVQRHHGLLTAKGIPNGGAEFTVTIPLEHEDQMN